MSKKYVWYGKYIKYAITLLPKNKRKNKDKKEYIKFHNCIFKNKNIRYINNND